MAWAKSAIPTVAATALVAPDRDVGFLGNSALPGVHVVPAVLHRVA